MYILKSRITKYVFVKTDTLKADRACTKLHQDASGQTYKDQRAQDRKQSKYTVVENAFASNFGPAKTSIPSVKFCLYCLKRITDDLPTTQTALVH